MNSWTGLGAKPGDGGDGQAVKEAARAVEAVTKKAIEPGGVTRLELQNGETLQTHCNHQA
jgi:hypothetical protein